jgi:ubiquinone/menaquinone biosynthesis C-methylase UbiE
MNQQSIGANPIGMIGKLAGILMNYIHNHQYKSIVKKIYETQRDKNIKILDIGCGGGIAIKHFANLFKEAQIYGIDISPDMVRLSSELNKKTISEGRVKIFCNNVEKMDIDNQTISIISIFDNINFWDDYSRAFSEMKRILKTDGRIIIVNGYPEIGTKWYDFVKFKNVDEYKNLLENNGFSLKGHEIIKHTIIIEGRLC